MKFGNYNLNTKDKPRKAEMFRLNKFKSSTNNFIDRFHNKIETFRHLNSRSESPLSYRASLFETFQNEEFHEDAMERFSEKDFPVERFSQDQFYVYGDTVRKIGMSNKNTIRGKNKFVNENYYESLKLVTPPRFTVDRKAGSETKKVQRQNSVLKEFLDTPTNGQLNADLEFKVLKEYLESSSYSDIVRDPDFKDYLNKKNYTDCIDYMKDSTYTTSTNSFASSRISDKLNIKEINFDKKPLKKSKSLGNLYETVDPFPYKKDYEMLPKSETSRNNGFCNSLKRLKFGKENKVKKCNENCEHSRKYDDVRNICQLLIGDSSTLTGKFKAPSTLGRKYTESRYNKLIDNFIKLKGFQNVDHYVYVKFGSLIDQARYDEDAEQSKKYIENIGERYHVTKKKFMDAADPLVHSTCSIIKQNQFPSTVNSNDYYFKKRYNNNNNNSIDRTYNTRNSYHQDEANMRNNINLLHEQHQDNYGYNWSSSKDNFCSNNYVN